MATSPNGHTPGSHGSAPVRSDHWPSGMVLWKRGSTHQWGPPVLSHPRRRTADRQTYRQGHLSRTVDIAPDVAMNIKRASAAPWRSPSHGKAPTSRSHTPRGGKGSLRRGGRAQGGTHAGRPLPPRWLPRCCPECARRVRQCRGGGARHRFPDDPESLGEINDNEWDCTFRPTIGAYLHLVKAVLPPTGPIWIPLTPPTMPAERVESVGSQLLLNRAIRSPELAPIYVPLASHEASYVPGARIAVIGGNPILWTPRPGTVSAAGHPRPGRCFSTKIPSRPPGQRGNFRLGGPRDPGGQRHREQPAHRHHRAAGRGRPRASNVLKFPGPDG